MSINISYAVEAILFATGEPVGKRKIATALKVDIGQIDEAVKDLSKSYDEQSRGLMIIEIDDGYQLCSRPMYYTYIQEIFGEQRKQALSNAAMEALTIVAYKQPVTRGQVEQIRGVNSDGAINRLVERGLVDEVGRLDAPGRPILYGTTPAFLRCFGLKSLDALPVIPTKPIQSRSQFQQLTMDSSAVL